jgi:hypothetical protein
MRRVSRLPWLGDERSAASGSRPGPGCHHQVRLQHARASQSRATGALGQHIVVAAAPDANAADVAALRWALRLGRRLRVNNLTFRTDSTVGLRRLGQTPRRCRWLVEWAPRRALALPEDSLELLASAGP